MSRTAHVGRRHVVERVAAALPVIVAFNQPMPDGSSCRYTGRLVAAILCDSQVHHYRVSLGNGVMQLTPPTWIDRDSWQDVLAAGLVVPDQWGISLPSAEYTRLVAIVDEAAARWNASATAEGNRMVRRMLGLSQGDDA